MSRTTSKVTYLDEAPPAHSGGMPPGGVALTKLGHVRAELAKLYREARQKKIDVADASRLANMLQILARVISDGELERRIIALEKKVK